MSQTQSDKNFHRLLLFASWIATIIVALIFIFVAWEAWPAIASGPLKFISDPAWDPSSQSYYLVPMIAGSTAITLGAIVIALPLGLISALFYELLAPSWISKPYRSTIEVLAGIPSVIYGFWGLVSVVPLLYKLSPPGANVLAGSIVLGIMILPTISLFIANGIRSVPKHIFTSSHSLRLSKYTMILKIIIPSIKGPIVSGTLIALGRAAGETMAVLMVCGNIVKVPTTFFDPVRTLTSNIALEMAYALDNHRSALFLSGLVLLLMIITLTALSQLRFFKDPYES